MDIGLGPEEVQEEVMGSKLPSNVHYRDVWKVLVKLGFEPVKRTATHVLFVRSRTRDDPQVRYVTLICHDPIKKGTLLNIIHGTGKTKEEFLDIL